MFFMFKIGKSLRAHFASHRPLSSVISFMGFQITLLIEKTVTSLALEWPNYIVNPVMFMQGTVISK